MGDWHNVMTTDFITGKTEIWNVSENSVITSGHGGGDYNLMRDFLQAVAREDESLLSSKLEASMASHLIGFKAEQSRLSNETIEIDEDL